MNEIKCGTCWLNCQKIKASCKHYASLESVINDEFKTGYFKQTKKTTKTKRKK